MNLTELEKGILNKFKDTCTSLRYSSLDNKVYLLNQMKLVMNDLDFDIAFGIRYQF